MNNIEVAFFNEETKLWQDLTPYCVLPFKFSNLLDEQLDEAELQLTRVPSSITFAPQTKFKIKIVNNPKAKYPFNDYLFPPNLITYEGITTSKQQDNSFKCEKEILMLVAEDNATEYPSGSNKYNHNIYLIEITKLLEGFIGDSITFTNSLGQVTEEVGKSKVDYYQFTRLGSNREEAQGSFFSSIFPNFIPLDTNGIVILSPQNINAGESLPSSIIFPTQYDSYIATLTLKNSSGETIDVVNNKADLSLGTYTALYDFSSSTGTPGQQGYYYCQLTLTYTFTVVESRYPIKKWTITDVINRTLELIELQSYDKRPRFILQGVSYLNVDGKAKRSSNYTSNSLAQKFESILSPEFSFTKMTLREQLQMIGGFIHAEPKITGIKSDSFGEYFEIGFEEYGNEEQVNLSNYPTILKSEKVGINDYCTSLDSSIDNLINTLDYAQGVIYEPFSNAKKTVRAETTAIRLEENGNTIIQTTFPIYEIKKLSILRVSTGKTYDITPYVYSVLNYNNLSSFEGSFPFIKAYALYYNQGEPNITGMFFRNPNAVSQVFEEYAIANILSVETGENIDININNLVSGLAFSIEYIPIVSERVRTNKPLFKKGLPRTVAYNQSANNIEQKYLGENLKGVISRLGNVEKTITYPVAFLSQVPKLGIKVDSEFYISTISVEVLPTYLKVSLGLTKNFNRLSEYVGINSTKRMWEVSEKQVQERQSVLCEYLMITKNINDYQNQSTFFSFNGIDLITKTLRLCSTAVVWGQTKNNNVTQSNYFALPVISSAIGNALSFTFGFEDNYSAGRQIVESTKNGNKSYFSNYAPYTDYWGRMYYLNFVFSNWYNVAPNLYSKNDLPIIPSETVTFLTWTNTEYNVAQGKINYQKDNREIPKITYELQAITDGDLIIGSALASNCGLVNIAPKKLYYIEFNQGTVINNINSDLKDLIANSSNYQMFEFKPYSSTYTQGYRVVNGNLQMPNVEHKKGAWAIITEGVTTTLEVADEDGNVITQDIQEGYELVIGSNTPRSANDNLTLGFFVLNDIYSKT